MDNNLFINVVERIERKLKTYDYFTHDTIKEISDILTIGAGIPLKSYEDYRSFKQQYNEISELLSWNQGIVLPSFLSYVEKEYPIMLKGIVRDKNDSEEKKLQHNKSLRNKELTERGALTSQYIENLMKSYKKKNKNKKIKSYSQDILDKLKKYIDASLDTCQFIKSSRLDIVNGNISIDGYIFPTSLSQINPNIDNVDYSVCRGFMFSIFDFFGKLYSIEFENTIDGNIFNNDDGRDREKVVEQLNNDNNINLMRKLHGFFGDFHIPILLTSKGKILMLSCRNYRVIEVGFSIVYDPKDTIQNLLIPTTIISF